MIHTRRSIPTAYRLIGWKLYDVSKQTKVNGVHELLDVLL